MPAPRIAELADALTTALNVEFSGSFTASRSWQPVYDLEQLNALRVSVVPRSRASTRVARNRDQHDHTIDVTFQRSVGESTLESEVDSLAELVQQVADYLARQHLTVSGQKHPPISITVDPVCAVEDLDGMRLFGSVVTCVYREWRDVA